MALIPKVTYAGQTVGSDPNYPEGKAQNVTVAGDGTGTPLEEKWVNDLWGWLQALLVRAGITPSGTPDQVGTSQYLDSLTQWFGTDSDLKVIGWLLDDYIENFNQSFSPAQVTNFIGNLTFSTDGSKLYTFDTVTPSNIFEYDLGTAWDVSTAVYNSNSFDPSTETGSARGGLRWSPDGTRFYIASNTNDAVYQYNASTPFDITSLVYSTNSVSIAGEDLTPSGIEFKPDGTQMYVVGRTNDAVYQYTLSTGWDLSTASYAGKSMSVAAQTALPVGIVISADGRTIIISDNTSDVFRQYTMTTPWDLATGSYDSIAKLSQSTDLDGLAASPDGSRLFYTSQAPGGNLVKGAHMGRLVVGP